jgi:predicted metal-dependent HD superfamily phosphohydrolase
MKGYIKIRKRILGILNTKLPKGLYYHGIHHTLDALHVSDRYIKQCYQNIKRDKQNDHIAKLLRLGVLFHDIGFTVSFNEHELRGTEIAEKIMNEYSFSQEDIDIVKGLIMATRIPQTPNNYLEKIICDVDLDYLGRNDFYKISNQLYEELKFNRVVSNKLEWNKIQIKFLEAHKYHTDFAKKYRQPEKEKRIAEIKELVKRSK